LVVAAYRPGRQPRYELAVDDLSKPVTEVPDFYETARTGIHFLLPVSVLIWCLMVEEMSPGLAASGA
jgi:TRAP-type uncharacterized transport system fused permease subunit